MENGKRTVPATREAFLPAVAAGAFMLGAIRVGVVAVGRLTIRRAAVDRALARRIETGEVVVRCLRVETVEAGAALPRLPA